MDQAAFRSFYQSAAPALRAYIARSCGSMDMADDILQETFMRFLQKAPRDLSEPRMRGYLYRIANSLIIDHWRRRQREQVRDREATALKEPAVHREFDNDVNNAFLQLKPQERSLLWMAYVEEFDHREIAVAAGIKEKSVRVLLFRARKALASILARAGLGSEIADA